MRHSQNVYSVSFERLGCDIQHRLNVRALSSFEASHIALKAIAKQTGFKEESFISCTVKSLGIDRSFLSGKTETKSKVLDSRMYDKQFLGAL